MKPPAAKPAGVRFRGPDALRAYLNPQQERKRRKRRGEPAPARRPRMELLFEALALLDAEVKLWPDDLLRFCEHNAEVLNALYVERDEDARQPGFTADMFRPVAAP